MSSFYHKAAPCLTALRQLQLNAPVAAECLFGAIGIDRLEFPETGGDQDAGRRDSPPDHVLHDRDGARGREVPLVRKVAPVVGRISCGRRRGSTQAISPGICFSSSVSALAACRARRGPPDAARLPGVEEHFRLEHKAVTHDAHVGTIAQDGAQPAEEVRAIARELLHPLRQRDIQPLAKVGNGGPVNPCPCSRLPPAPTRSPRAGAAAPRSAG